MKTQPISLQPFLSSRNVVPTLWRYLLGQYGKVFALSLFGFLIILLSTRLEDAAKFLGLGASFSVIIRFIIYQIPYVLQVALPISALIATLYLFGKMSSSSELTAIRASGISLFKLIAPILLLNVFFSLMAFAVMFDLSAKSHFAAKKMEFDIRSMHPLAILQNAQLLHNSGISIDMKGSLQHEGSASDLIVAMRNGEDGRSTLIIAKKITQEQDTLKGQNCTFITSLESPSPQGFDQLVIENAKENSTPLKNISFITSQKKGWKTYNDQLSLPVLLAKKNDLWKKYEQSRFFDKKPDLIIKSLGRCYAELLRRFSLSLSITTFTIMGIAYGISLGRTHSRKRFMIVLLLVAFYLFCYLGAKAMEEQVFPSIALFILPHIVIIWASILKIIRIQKGIES